LHQKNWKIEIFGEFLWKIGEKSQKLQKSQQERGPFAV